MFKNKLGRLNELKSILQEQSYDQVYLLCGNDKAGKKTLIHYLMGSPLNFQTDEEGQNIFTFDAGSEEGKIQIVENVLSLYPSPEQKILYLRLNELQNNAMTPISKIEWTIVFQYLAKQLIQWRGILKFILVLSSLEDIAHLLENYEICFKIFENFAERTKIAVTKIVDEEEYQEFTEVTVNDIVQVHQNLQFVQNLVEEGQVFVFYCREVDEEEREDFSSRLMSSTVPKQLHLSPENFRGLYLACISEEANEMNLELKNQSCNMLKKEYEIIDYLVIFSLEQLSSTTIVKNLPLMFSEKCKQLFDQQVALEKNSAFSDQENVRKFISIYEALYRISKTDEFYAAFCARQKQILALLLPESLRKMNFLEKMSLFELAYQNYAEKEDSKQLMQVFCEGQMGCFSNQLLGVAFFKLQPLFSKQFVEENEEIMKSLSQTKKSKLPKAKKQKKKIPIYEEQKRAYLEQKPSILQVIKLPLSPLKLDLLLEQIGKPKQSNRNIMEEKFLLSQAIYLLKTYRQQQMALQLAWVMPDFNYFQQSAQILLQEFRAQQPQAQALNLIESVVQFLYKSNRKHLALNFISILESYKYPEQSQKQELKAKLAEYSEHMTKNISSIFMDYARAKPVIDSKNEIIQKCIDYESKNWNEIESILLIQELKNSYEFISAN